MRGIDVKVRVVVGVSSQPGSDKHMHGVLNAAKKIFYSTRHIECSDTCIEH